MARVLGLVERSLAVDLWEEAIQREPLDDDSILLAVDVAHRLGLKEGTLMRDFHRIAMSGHPAVRTASFDEIVEMMGRQRQVQERANRDYSAGAAPVHVISAMAGWPMAAIYHSQLERNAQAESPLRQSPIMIRHGSRPLDQEVVLETGTLVADVTAIMLAEQIGILDLIERHLGPVFISSWLPHSLDVQRARAEPHDAATDQAREGVLDLVREKRISVAPISWPLPEPADPFGHQMGPVWCAWLERMKEKDGVIVDFVPLTSNDGKRQIVAIPQEERSRIISLEELLEGLRRRGVLTTADLETAAARIGVNAQVQAACIDLPPGRFVFLEQGIAEEVFRAGLLERVCEYCQVEIGESAHLFLESDVAAAKTRVELAEWLLRLLDRLRRGIQENRYKTFTNALEESTVPKGFENADFRCLHDLISARSEGGRVVWCDDRFINAHVRTGAGPLVSTMEVLGDLRRRGVLSEDRYFGKLLDLRRMGIRHLSLSSDEILYYLRSARIEGDRVAETPALATLRMATAAAVRDTERVQVLPAGQFSPDSPGEFQWLIELREAVSEAILETWKQEEIPIAVARSEWLFESVHFDMEALWDLLSPEALADGMPPFFADVLRLFLVGVCLPHAPFGGPDSADSKRRMFYRWLYFRIVAPVLRTNRELEAALGKELARAIDSYAEPVKNAPEVRRLVAFQMLGVYQDLPQAMRDFIAPSQLLVDEFGVRGGEIAIRVANHVFPFCDFLHGAAEAVNGRDAIIKTFDGVDCALAPGVREEFGHVVLLTTPLAESALPISSELLPLLYDDLGLRRRYLNQHPELFDLPRHQRNDAIEKIVAMPDLIERTEVAREYTRRSAEHFYRDLQVKLAQGFALRQDDLMPPAVNSLAQHLRIDVSGSIDWNSSARRLVEDEGLAETIFRLGGLPIRLPEAARFAARQLEDAEFEKLLSSLGSRMLTPISLLHCFHLIADRAARNPTWLSRAVAARDRLLTKQTRIEKFPGFIAILRWCFEGLRQRMETQEWHSWVIIACAWIHASRIHNIQLESGVQAEEVESRFSQLFAAAPILLDQRRIEIRDDVAHANHVNWPIFLTRGLGDVIMSVRIDAGRALAPDPEALLQAFGNAEPVASDTDGLDSRDCNAG